MSKKRRKSKKVKGLRRYRAEWATRYLSIPRSLTLSAKNKNEAYKLIGAQAGDVAVHLTCLKKGQ